MLCHGLGQWPKSEGVRQGKFEATKVLLLARLAEEERVGIPFMRTHFTHAEMRVVRTRRWLAALTCLIYMGMPKYTCRGMDTWEARNNKCLGCQQHVLLLLDSASLSLYSSWSLGCRLTDLQGGNPLDLQHITAVQLCRRCARCWPAAGRWTCRRCCGPWRRPSAPTGCCCTACRTSCRRV